MRNAVTVTQSHRFNYGQLGPTEELVVIERYNLFSHLITNSKA